MKTAISSFTDALDPSWSDHRLLAEILTLEQHTNTSSAELLNAVALELAYRFDQSRMTYDEAMGKAAVLYNAVLGRSEIPQHLDEVYWALDEGEYGSADDAQRSGDSPKLRVQQKIQSILASLQRDDA